jgi:anti-sigma regulatory factor (Ser/Thr protein kinase)
MGELGKQSEEIRNFILENVDEHSQDIVSFAASRFSISRQAAHRHIQQLMKSKRIAMQGATRNRKYSLQPLVRLKLPLNPDLQEDRIWRKHICPRLEGIPRNVLEICQYGFTEMVNNAIEHSAGNALLLILKRTPAKIELRIQDNGVGIFNKIQKRLNLDDPLHAILELAKGKMTTDPEHHTGEGIFFTSRMFDEFIILAGHLFFAHSETSGDWLLEDQEDNAQGTLIVLTINSSSARTTQQVFDKYTAQDDYGFTKTHVPVSLARYGDENLISRSQAKRLLTRFERFKEIILDFDRVDTIGQAFADEIFRVFQRQNPQVRLTPVNTSEQIQKMISRVTSKTAQEL